jgi:hypothetical protein
MKTFPDTTGRTWTVAVTVDAIKRVRGLANVDLMTVIDGKLVGRLSTDPVLLVDVLYALCKPEADAAGVSDEDFGRAMAGDAIGLATDALLEDLADFFPSARRTVLRKALAKTRAVEARAGEIAGAKIDAMDVEDLMRRALGGSAGSSPGPSASTPAP